MSISPSSTQIFCQRCGHSFLKSDSVGRYFFLSSSFPLGSYASPSQISALSESILYCPKCFERDRDRALGDFSIFIEPMDERVDPDGLDQERGEEGDADVIHRPKEL